MSTTPPVARDLPATTFRFAALPVLLAVAVAAALMLGSVAIAPATFLQALRPGSPAGDPSGEVMLARIILHHVRLPRVIAAAGAGAALAVAGLVMQTVFRNPLAGPGVLGVSAGAGLGVALVILAGVGMGLTAPTVSAAIAGAAAVLLLVLAIHRMVHQPVIVLVLGLLFGYAASAVTTILLSGSSPDGLQRYVQWSFGSFALAPGAGPGALVAAAAVSTAALTVRAVRLDALLLGSAYAESMGIDSRRLERLLLVLAGILTGLVTALTGPISFLGVATPHITRGYLRTSRHTILVPATALWGAILAVLADLVARLPGTEATLPLNAVLSVIGVPVVLMVVLRPVGRHSSGGGVHQ